MIQHIRHCLGKSFPEGRDLRRLHGQSGCLGMAAELDQMVPAPVQGLVQVQGRDAPAGSFGGFSADGKKHRRQMVFFRHPGGHDADDTGVPSFLSQDDAPFRAAQRSHLMLCLFEDLLAQGLPFLVGRIQFCRQFPGFFRVLGRQEMHRRHSVIQPAGGVDPGTQAEPDGAAVHGAAGSHGHLEQGLEAAERAVGHFGQAFPDDFPVFIPERHHIRYGAQSHQFDQVLPVKSWVPGELLFQSLA